MERYSKTKQALENTLNLLVCSKCFNLPDGNVCILSNCKHKYCGSCFQELNVGKTKTKKCITCNQLSPIQTCSTSDVFSTMLLNRLRKIEKYLKNDSPVDDSPEDGDNIKPLNSLKNSKKLVNSVPIVIRKSLKRNHQSSDSGSSIIKSDSGGSSNGTSSNSSKPIIKQKPQSSTSNSSSIITEPRSSKRISSNKNSKISAVSLSGTTSSEESIPTIGSDTSTTLNSPATISRKNEKGETLLHVACRNGQIEKVKRLLKMSADINARDFAGWTPLHEAVNGKTKNALTIIEILLESKCNVNVVGGFGETPLHEASRLGNMGMVKLLLSYSASPKIPNDGGEFPKDCAKTTEIGNLIQKYAGPYKRKLSKVELESLTLLKQSKVLLYFTYKPSREFLGKLESVFKFRISKTLTDEVTHMIFETKPKCLVELNLKYLLGILSGAWLLSFDWLEESLSKGILEDPDSFQIGGYSKKIYSSDGGSSGTLERSRLNREQKNPGLFNGISFYIYKNSTFQALKLSKKDLGSCISFGAGVVLIREPNPDGVDPLDNPVRFHAKDQNHKMVLTSHVILYGAGNEPPKKHNLEHVKTLHVDWLIESVLNFALADPDQFN